jgi:DNA-binding MarR family transcriptional regulator
VLLHKGPLATAAIEEKVRLATAPLKTVDRLEPRGLVRRRPSTADRRVKVLVLTPTGARLRALLLDRMTAPPAALERLSLREQRALVRILTRLLEQG